MRKQEGEEKSIFDFAQNAPRRTSPRTLANNNTRNEQVIEPAKAAEEVSALFEGNVWQEHVKRMQEELDNLKEQLRFIEKSTGISLSQAIQLPDHFSEEQKQIYETHVKQREKSLDRLIVIPKYKKEREEKVAHSEKRERMIHTMGKRKRWIPL